MRTVSGKRAGQMLSETRRAISRRPVLYLSRLVVVVVLLYLPHFGERLINIVVVSLGFMAAGLLTKKEEDASLWNNGQELRPFATTIVLILYRYVHALPPPWNWILGIAKGFAVVVAVLGPPPGSLPAEDPYGKYWRLLWDGGTLFLWILILGTIAVRR